MKSWMLLLSASALAGVAVSGLAAPAWAQAQQSPANESVGLDEIIVTANRRAENVQDVAAAVTAINAAQVESAFARDLMDLRSISPNLVIDPILGNGTAAISIRGMQLNDVEKSFDPAVAVYLDGVYLASTTGALLSVFDAEAVEVLRGPQGTLFGRNTIGGLMHIRRAKPSGELGGRVMATYGSYERLDFQGVVNSPSFANDTLKAKFTFVTQSGGGYFFNTSRNKREGWNDYLQLGASVLWEPSDRAELWLTYDYIDDKTPTRPVTSLSVAGQAFCIPGVFQCGQPPSNANFHRRPTTTLDQWPLWHRGRP
jgi:iron complex outermembrane recepter protein